MVRQQDKLLEGHLTAYLNRLQSIQTQQELMGI